jgi:hypothetical protein
MKQININIYVELIVSIQRLNEAHYYNKHEYDEIDFFNLSEIQHLKQYIIFKK